MPRQVLSISSQVAYGPVGNSASVPAIQAAGFTVSQIPTIILSNHPGLGKPSGVKLPPTELEAILKSLEALGALDACVGVMTGYFASTDQINVAASFIHKMKEKNPSLYVLVDPVLGDDGSLYVSSEVANAIRDELLPLASCITPNCFELGWLSGKPVSNKAEVLLAAATLPHKEILATSIPLDANNLATLAITGSECSQESAAIKPSVPHGTGDFLAGLYFAARLNGFESREALKLSTGILDSAISRSLGQPCLDIIGALHNPS
ncbi:MAG TPA: pyridoxal kinase [Aestuariivirga sp.]|nr:pyridoxal kinase [Aestuariivirga sp.]